ncbi:uncharacterized protein B0H64DRAFT_196991 [Chaetomium fimeti]|uniref:Uncharacterized protein n=1 Tax=Chaetomium fimeti TaxID=1854472 RepID=A0AAE0HEB0_9PEZI|nr:hypothetical protein B0H64DRAFT_196991 [Chaetomium fimeti]
MVLTGDRITKVSLGSYDQVVAITQFMINNGIQNLWKAHRNDEKMKSKLDQNLGSAMGSVTGVAMEAPRVQVEWQPNDASQIMYFMTFNSGKLTVNKAEVGDDEDPAEFDMKGWTLALPVVLGMKELKTDDPVYKRKIAALVPGQYSVTRLLVAISAAKSLVDFEKSSLGSVDWKKTWDETVRRRVTLLLQELVNVLFKYALNTIGYSVKSKDTQLIKKEHPPTFQPTALRFQTYPWRDPAKPDDQATTGLTGNAALNYLLYLEMTDGHPVPVLEAATLPYKGNWTEGRLDSGANAASVDFGTFAMSGKNFLEAYLLPKLRHLNKIMEPRVKDLDVTLYWDGWPSFRYNWNCGVRVGYNVDRLDANDPVFDFKRSATNPNAYEYTSKYDSTTDSNLSQHKDIGWFVEASGSASCSCKNTVEYTPGSPEIVIKGESKVQLYYWYKNLTSDDDTLNYKVTWKITLTLQSVSDGGLQIAVKADKPVSTKDYTMNEGKLNQYGDWLEDAYIPALSNLSHMEAALVNDLSGQQKFYFPASGTFFFKDPVINAEGALICSIGYNGADDFANPDTTTVRKNVQATPLAPPKEPLKGGIDIVGTSKNRDNPPPS